MSEPTIRRKFQLTDLTNNNNKTWAVEYWEDTHTMTTTWGRTNAAKPQSQTKKNISRYQVEKIIDEKIAKGYVELDLHIPIIVTVDNTPVQPIEPKLQTFLDWIFRESGQYISTYLATSVDALSQNQINKGRDILKDIDNAVLAMYGGGQFSAVIEQVEYFFNTIPTRLPSRINVEEVAKEFISNLAEHEDRLNQLEQALSQHVIQRQGNDNLLSQLGGVELTVMDNADPRFTEISDFCHKTIKSHERVKQIIEVCIPHERAAYEAETKGSRNITSLWHGSKTHNVNHILKSGLIVPQHAANGRRLGDGIYLTDWSRRALSYAGSNYGNQSICLLVETKLGRMKEEPGSARYTEAPSGYDSVWGSHSWSGMDEYVVYKTSQQTIRAILVVE